MTPVPKLNIPELIKNACVKPKDNDYEYIIHVSPVSKRNQDQGLKKKYTTKTVTPRGAYIDKLIDLSEKNELFG